MVKINLIEIKRGQPNKYWLALQPETIYDE
ncbi:hypothetical protein FHW36_101641 [Chitinophaga polysaccharea]|uniref:Uncharacterized protein n=1 Tax=Chitinophaga polysaccharea TaxID=1293035 RepID=A0A561Q302_9BACT|nr:hypothetical protein FHW36_101641 [Chitinophaga polysaccharea]